MNVTNDHYDEFIMNDEPYATISGKVVPTGKKIINAHDLRKRLMKAAKVVSDYSFIWLVKENKPNGRVFESKNIDLDECKDFVLLPMTYNKSKSTWNYPENYIG